MAGRRGTGTPRRSSTRIPVYKDIDQVMADQPDLVTVDHALHQVLNYKGT